MHNSVHHAYSIPNNFQYVSYAQRLKTLNERKKRPQRILALEKQP